MLGALSPKISVVTVNFNMADDIAGTLDSVLSQDYPNFESIVIDGGSADGSRDIIRRYSGRVAYWVSEPDRNLYDGMNKGVRAASGDWVLFMNSGDHFAHGTALSCMFAEDHSGVDVLYGHHVRRYAKQGIERTILAEPPSVLPLRMHCSHQSIFMRRTYLRGRPFSLNLLAADYESILSAYVSGKTFKLVDCVVSIASVGGRSDRHRLASLGERVSIVRRHGLMTFGLGLHYARLMIWAALAQKVKAVIPAKLLAHILRRRPMTGMG